MLLIAHKSLRTRPAIPSRAKRCRVHRIPSRVRDDRDTPLWWGGMRKILDVIWGEWEQKYFRKIRNKTRQPCQQNARRANHLSQSCRPLSVFARVPDGNPSVIPRCAIAHRGCATDLGFTRVRQHRCPSRQQPTWMRRPGIHTPRGGYGFGARSLRARPGMTDGFPSATRAKTDNANNKTGSSDLPVGRFVDRRVESYF